MRTFVRGFLVGWSFLSVLLLSLSAQAQYPVISAEELRERIRSEKRTVIVDVRPRDEYFAGHVPGAVNIPADKIGREYRKLPKDKSTPLVFYCRGAG